jgi:predicted nuclease with RNAse H fold
MLETGSLSLESYSKLSSLSQTVVGVDVGGLKKGFHAVAIRDQKLFDKLTTHHPAAIVEWCRTLNVSVVGIDAPCNWSLTGRSRCCEQQLARAGINAFATPSQAIGEVHAFYGWMLNGAKLFRLLSPNYQLFDGRQSALGTLCFETFPHAVACALAGRTLSAKQKRSDRRRLLSDAGLAIDFLKNIDEIDAALCALTAHHLSVGTFRTYGDNVEGFIVVPQLS